MPRPQPHTAGARGVPARADRREHPPRADYGSGPRPGGWPATEAHRRPGRHRAKTLRRTPAHGAVDRRHPRGEALDPLRTPPSTLVTAEFEGLVPDSHPRMRACFRTSNRATPGPPISQQIHSTHAAPLYSAAGHAPPPERKSVSLRVYNPQSDTPNSAPIRNCAPSRRGSAELAPSLLAEAGWPAVDFAVSVWLVRPDTGSNDMPFSPVNRRMPTARRCPAPPNSSGQWEPRFHFRCIAGPIGRGQR